MKEIKYRKNGKTYIFKQIQFLTKFINFMIIFLSITFCASLFGIFISVGTIESYGEEYSWYLMVDIIIFISTLITLALFEYSSLSNYVNLSFDNEKEISKFVEYLRDKERKKLTKWVL